MQEKTSLWDKITNRHQNNVFARKNRSLNNNVYQSIINDNNYNSNNGLASGDTQDWINGGKGIANLYNAYKGSGTGSSSSPIVQNAINSEVYGGGSSGSAITDAISGTGGGGSAVTDALNTEMGSSGGSSGGGSSVPWAAIAMAAKGGYNKLSNKTDKDYSDVEEAIIYPIQGAAMGSSYSGGNPWATAGGAAYGLGYAFKDDLGMKDSNFLTQMVFPIDLGDGGGLKIGGKGLSDLF